MLQISAQSMQSVHINCLVAFKRGVLTYLETLPHYDGTAHRLHTCTSAPPQVMSSTTGGNTCMMDLVAWHVDPCSHQSGFTPHRDRHLGLEEQDFGEVQAGFRQENGCSPRDSTCWIALADAAPDNGQCSHLAAYMHMPPRPPYWYP